MRIFALLVAVVHVCWGWSTVMKSGDWIVNVTAGPGNSSSVSVLKEGFLWLESSPLILRSNHTWHKAGDGSLGLQNASQSRPTVTSGCDVRGACFSEVALHWTVPGNRTVVTGVRAFLKPWEGVVEFVTRFVDGLEGTSYRNVSVEDGNLTSVSPFCGFPSWDTSKGGLGNGSLWHVTFGALEDEIGGGGGGWGAPPDNETGLIGGPVVFVGEGSGAAVASSGEGGKLVVMQHMGVAGANTSWAAGLSGEVDEVVEGTNASWVLISGTDVMSAMDLWGAWNRNRTRRAAVSDVGVEYVSVSTSVGSVLSATMYNADTDPENPWDNVTCCAASVLNATYRALNASGIQPRMLHLDSWWYRGPHPQSLPPYNFEGPKCIQEWTPPDWAFPQGLQALEGWQALSLYGAYFCEQNQFQNIGNFTPQIGAAVLPDATSAPAVYDAMLAMLVAAKGQVLQLDRLGELFLTNPIFRTVPGAYESWFSGLVQAATKHRVAIRLGGAFPNDLDLKGPISTVRGTTPYANMNHFFQSKASMLLNAAGLLSDVGPVWSTSGEFVSDPNFTPIGRMGDDIELGAISTTLSRGPWAIGDAPNQFNASRITQATRSDGRILHPSLPLTPISLSFLPPSSSSSRSIPPKSDISIAFTAPITSTPPTGQFLVLSFFPNKSSTFELQQQDLHPADQIHKSDILIAHDWHRTCIPNSNARTTNCIWDIHPQSPNATVFPIKGFEFWPNTTLDMAYITVTTATPDYYVLLGELDKHVPLSPYRFQSLTLSKTNAVAEVQGAPRENVTLTALQPLGDNEYKVQIQSQLLSSSGKATFTFHPV